MFFANNCDYLLLFSFIVVSTVALVEEIEKISKELGYGEDWLSRFDLAVGVSAGGIASLLTNATNTTVELVETGRGLVEDMGTLCMGRINWFDTIFKCDGLKERNQFNAVAKDFLGHDNPIKNDNGIRSVAVCAAREEGNFDGMIEPFLLRTYENPECSSTMGGTCHMSLPNAIHATSSLPMLAKRIRTHHDGKAITLADGAFITVAPVNIAILEAEKLYPNRTIGTIVSLGLGMLDLQTEISVYKAVDLARISHPNLHFHRINPIEALKGHQTFDSNLEKYARLEAKVKKWIREDHLEQVMVENTLQKLFDGTPCRRNKKKTSKKEIANTSTAKYKNSNRCKEREMLRQSMATTVGLKDKKYIREEVKIKTSPFSLEEEFLQETVKNLQSKPEELDEKIHNSFKKFGRMVSSRQLLMTEIDEEDDDDFKQDDKDILDEESRVSMESFPY